jgi:hypothetical protein
VKGHNDKLLHNLLYSAIEVFEGEHVHFSQLVSRKESADDIVLHQRNIVRVEVTRDVLIFVLLFFNGLAILILDLLVACHTDVEIKGKIFSRCSRHSGIQSKG